MILQLDQEESIIILDLISEAYLNTNYFSFAITI
jgi:hypothetical protein